MKKTIYSSPEIQTFNGILNSSVCAASTTVGLDDMNETDMDITF